MIRLWHWANTIVISGSLITILINSGLFGDRTPGLSAERKFLLEMLEDKVWGVHIYFGYVLAGLFLFRIILEFFQHPDQQFFHHLKAAYQDYFILQHKKGLARHELAVSAIYLTFYAVLAVIVLSGLTLAFQDQLSLQRSLAHSVKEVHGFCMYLILAFIVVHLGGIFMAERKDSNGIVSDMINGGKHA